MVDVFLEEAKAIWHSSHFLIHVDQVTSILFLHAEVLRHVLHQLSVQVQAVLLNSFHGY